MSKPCWVATAVVLATALAVTSAYGDTYYSVQKNGLWYWSLNLTQSLFPAPAYRASHPSTSTLVDGLGLTADEKRQLRAQLSVISPYSPFGPERSPVLADGSVVFKASCWGTGVSIPSPQVDLDLFHRFRCSLKTATYKRLAQFKASVTAARNAVTSAASPKPQSLLDGLVRAYARLYHYSIFGDGAIRKITIVVTGRRAYSVARS